MNTAVQLNLAVVRLVNTNAATLSDARAALKTISVNPTNSALRCQALRELAVDAMRYQQRETALALTAQLLQETNAVFRDRLMRLEVLNETRSPELKTALAGFQREASTNTANIFDLATWQLGKLGPSDTLAWLRTLPSEVQTNLPVPFVIADCQSLLQDWKGLLASLEERRWGEFEFIRYALKTRALRGAIFVVFAPEGTFASCFKLREVFNIIGKNAGPFFTAWGISIVASLVVGLVVGFAQMVLGLIPCVGWVISIVLSLGVVVYTSMIYSHLFGQFGQRAYGQAPLIPADQPV